MEKYDLANRIYDLRKERNISQKELGGMLGVSNKSVSKWETGSAIPKTETLVKLAEIFGVSPEELLRGTTDDKRTLGKLSIEANHYFLKEELENRDRIEKTKTVKSQKQYLTIITTLFLSVFLIFILVNLTGFFYLDWDNDFLSVFCMSLGISYCTCGIFNSIVLLARFVKKQNTLMIVLMFLFLPITFGIVYFFGLIMIFPEIFNCVRGIREDKTNGSKQG